MNKSILGIPTWVFFILIGGIAAGVAIPLIIFFAMSAPSISPAVQTVSFTYTCEGLTCKFNAITANENVKLYNWDFGDGYISLGKTTQRTFEEEGRYLVTLSVIDNKGKKFEKSETINVAVGAKTDTDREAMCSSDGDCPYYPCGQSTGQESLCRCNIDTGNCVGAAYKDLQSRDECTNHAGCGYSRQCNYDKYPSYCS